VEDLFVKSCGAGAGSKSKMVPTLVPFDMPAASMNPFNSPTRPATATAVAPATMVPMTLGDAFAKPATVKAKTPKAAMPSAMPSAIVTAVPVSKRAAPKPSLRANQEGSWNKFLKNWMAAHPGMKRPDAMKAAGDNWKAFKAGKAPAAAAAVGAAAGAPLLSSVGEMVEADEEAENDDKNLGLL
jgi:hypothetical protein